MGAETIGMYEPIPLLTLARLDIKIVGPLFRTEHRDLLSLLEGLPIQTIARIDLWARSLSGSATVWTPDAGFLGFPRDQSFDSAPIQGLELYFQAVWIRLRCNKPAHGWDLFNEQLAFAAIVFLTQRLQASKLVRPMPENAQWA